MRRKVEELVIEKDIEIPEAYQNRKVDKELEVIQKMEIGDSVRVFSRKDSVRVWGKMKKAGFKSISRRVIEGNTEVFRIWRVGNE